MPSDNSSQHLAAILPSKGSALEVTQRPTPNPGPNELLVEVKSIALNPLDIYQRDLGFRVASYPAVLGSDIAGTVISVGSSVSPAAQFKPGTRIAAFAPCFFVHGAPNYGGLQTRVLVPAENAIPVPDGISFNEASLLPMAVITAWAGWYTMGLPRDTVYTPSDKKGMFVWGGASSIGTAAIQSANLKGFVVYTTASEKHHEYLKGLGASKAFDYKDKNVVGKVMEAAKEEGVTFNLAFDAVGQLKECLEILTALRTEDAAKVASAIHLSENSPKADNIEVKFITGPEDEKESSEFFHFVFGVWLKEKLEKGEFVPSPKIQVIEGGLASAQKGLDVLKKGVSGVKLVLEV